MCSDVFLGMFGEGDFKIVGIQPPRHQKPKIFADFRRILFEAKG